MCHLHCNRPSRIAIAASGIALLLAGSALAQPVRVFDDAPSIEQLRSIMIPESQPGPGRTIVIQRPDTGAPPANVQRVATEITPAPRAPVAVAEPSAPRVERAAASVAPPPRPSPAKPAAEAKPGTVGFRINFAFGSAILPDSAHAMIDRVAELMNEAPQIKVRVEGHTDAVGSAGYNVSLSERRALSVATYLVKLGIDPARLMLVGKGMAEPLTANPYDPNNRRVQFVRVG
jgi:outer membrane protein OmpA-like peptidoglycan-associated protein